MTRKVFLLITLLLLPSMLGAANYKFQHLDSKRGLPHQQVEALALDAEGNLWIGTRNGLSRYDGYDIRTYYHTTDTRSLRHNLVHALHVDRQQRLWVATETGICRYCPERDDFRCYGEPQGLCWSIAENEDGELFFGGGALFRYDEQADSLLPLPLLDDAFVNSMAVAPNGELYVATNSEILRYDRSLSHITRLPADYYADFMTSRNVIVPLHFDCKGHLWIGRNGKGVMRVDLQTGEREVFAPEGPGSGFVRCIAEDSNHRMWLGTEGGITILSPDGSREVLRHRFLDANSLSDNAIYTILLDSARNVWVGSYFGGVDFMTDTEGQFQFFEPGDGEENIPARVPRAMTEPQAGTFWIATEDGGVCTFNSATGRFQAFHGIPGMGSNIHAIHYNRRQHEVWIGTRFEGIYRYDLNSHSSRHYLYSHGLTSEGCFSIAQKADGQLWVATMQGLRHYDDKADAFTTVGHNVLDSSFIYTLHIDRNDNLWAGTNNHGFYRIDAKTGAISGYTREDSTGLRDDYIICLHMDSKGRLWVGTNNNGLQYLDPATGRFGDIDEPMLSRCTVCSFEEDKAGNLWISTSQGLFRYHLESGAITRFSSESSGLPSNQFNYASSLRAQDGRLLFGTINGLIAFRPEQLHREQGPFNIHLKRLTIDNVEVLPTTADSPLEQVLDATTRIVLTHEQASHFTIEYGIIRPSGTAAINYQVRLEGVDRDWRDVGSERRFTGYKLPAGTYRLHLRASSSAEGWEESPVRTLEIVVRPPWWRSPWAYAFYLLLIGAIAYAVWRFSQLRLREKNDIRIAHLEREHLRELDKVKSDFFATAAHELKTPLTLVTAPLHSISRDQLDDHGREHLDMAIQNAGKLQSLIGELVTFNKIESGGFPFYLQRGNPLAFINRALQPFTDACREKHLTLNVATEDNGEEVWFSPSYLERILNNLMSNAIKFTPEGGAINVDARIDSRPDSPYTFLHFDVSDTGIGIVPEEMKNIFNRFYQTKRGYNTNNSGWGIGLSLVKRLVDIHKGQIDVQSEVGQGTTFSTWLCTSEQAFAPESLITDADTVQPIEQYMFSEQPVTRKPSSTENDDVNKSSLPLLLLVDDNTNMLGFLQQMFRDDYQVLTATNGREALELTHSHDVQMVISDVMMPEMDGNELCQRLKTDMQTSHIPVILLTAKGDPQDIYEGYQSGAEAYVPKPFDPQTLQLQVGNMLRLIKQRQQHIADTGVVDIEKAGLSELDKAFVQRMNEVVEHNLSNSDFGIADITEALGISRSLLHLKMKNILGLSMGDYIRNKRLDKACEMLRQGYNVSETAYDTGFSDPNYFSKTFKKHIGVSPKDYKISSEAKGL